MGANTSIQWTDHTFNPWWGCSRVSAGCANCYAETFAGRFGVGWGNSPRRIASEKVWSQPERWNIAAKKAKKRARVFCSSMADVFEDLQELAAPRQRLWNLIRATPWLDWQILTKRPENIKRFLPIGIEWGEGWPNVWLGTSAENQRTFDKRVPRLLEVPAVVHFVSAEPLLDSLDLRGKDFQDSAIDAFENDPKINWVIVGGESGIKARAFSVEWARSVIQQCKAAGVACFVKQLGAKPYWENIYARSEFDEGAGAIELDDRKGGDWGEWYPDLRIRQFPKTLNGGLGKKENRPIH